MRDGVSGGLPSMSASLRLNRRRRAYRLVATLGRRLYFTSAPHSTSRDNLYDHSMIGLSVADLILVGRTLCDAFVLCLAFRLLTTTIYDQRRIPFMDIFGHLDDHDDGDLVWPIIRLRS